MNKNFFYKNKAYKNNEPSVTTTTDEVVTPPVVESVCCPMCTAEKKPTTLKKAFAFGAGAAVATGIAFAAWKGGKWAKEKIKKAFSDDEEDDLVKEIENEKKEEKK